jgi:prepilin-type N-terminal cleavage/methylation domain-containing protein
MNRISANNVRRGFTLIELLIALMVASIIFSAVAALSSAVCNANDQSEDISRTQARVRLATVRIGDLINHAKLVCGTNSDHIAIWRNDDNSNNNINVNELVFIDKGSTGDYLKLIEFPSVTAVLSLSYLLDGTGLAWLENNRQALYTNLLTDCSGAEFYVDSAAPYTNFVSIRFNLEEAGSQTNSYEINGCLLGVSDNLVDGPGSAITSDDD